MIRFISTILVRALIALALVFLWAVSAQQANEAKADDKKDAGKQVNIVGALKVKEGTEKEMREIFAALVEPSRQNEGNLRYELYQDQNEPRRFVFVQRWTNEEAHRKHDREATHIQEFKKKHLEKVESAEIYQLTLVKGDDKPDKTGKQSAEEAVRAVLDRYQVALNASDTDAVMKLYAADGVFMPQNSSSAIGPDAVRKAYEAVFKAIKLKVKFKVEEVVVMAPEWAFARTNSSGTSKVNSSGKTSVEGNQELFIFKKGADGQWKIARYCFSTTNPPGK